jgi:hypothetical protein
VGPRSYRFTSGDRKALEQDYTHAYGTIEIRIKH